MRAAAAMLVALAGCHGAMAPPDTGGKQWIGSFRLQGVTSDGYAIVADAESQGVAVLAIAVDGSDEKMIAPIASGAGVSGRVVFAARPSSQGEITTAWSSTTGARDLDVLGLVTYTATPDGAYLAFNDDKAIYLAATDGSREQKVSDFSAQAGQCPSQIAFVGARLVILRCATATVKSTVTSFDLVSWVGTDLASGASSFVGDHAGTHLAILSPTGVSIVPVQGGDGVSLDGNFANVRFLPDDSALVYATADATLGRAPATGGMPIVLQSAGVLALRGVVSPDGRSLLYDSQIGANGSDLLLSSSEHPGAPITLSADPSAGLFGDSFTDDSSHALFSSAISARVDPQLGPFIGDFEAQPTDGSARLHLADLVWSWSTAGGARIVFNDHLANLTVGDFTTLADVEVFDLAAGAMPTQVATQADLDFYLTPDRKAVLYTSTGSLFLQPLP